MTDLFFVFGISLTIMAVVLAFVGMRMENFPSRGAMIGGLVFMAFLVVGSAAWAVALGREELEHREVEIAEYQEQQAEELDEGEEPADEQPVDAEPIKGGEL